MNIYKNAAAAAALFAGLFALQAGAVLPAALAVIASLLIIVDGFVNRDSQAE